MMSGPPRATYTVPASTTLSGGSPSHAGAGLSCESGGVCTHARSANSAIASTTGTTPHQRGSFTPELRENGVGAQLRQPRKMGSEHNYASREKRGRTPFRSSAADTWARPPFRRRRREKGSDPFFHSMHAAGALELALLLREERVVLAGLAHAGDVHRHFLVAARQPEPGAAERRLIGLGVDLVAAKHERRIVL